MTDPDALISRIYDLVEQSHVDGAVLLCLRLARCIGDHFNAVMFLRELRPDHRHLQQEFYEEVKDLSKDAQKYIWDQTLENWLAEHTGEFSLIPDEPDARVLALGIGEMQRESKRIDKDAQTFPSEVAGKLRLRATTIDRIVERIRARCLNYASRLERQRGATRRNVEFLASVQDQVNNYFAVHREDTYSKLQKASELVGSEQPEDRLPA